MKLKKETWYYSNGQKEREYYISENGNVQSKDIQWSFKDGTVSRISHYKDYIHHGLDRWYKKNMRSV